MSGTETTATVDDHTEPPWLSTTEPIAPPDGSDLGQILRVYREVHDLTQAELALRLHITQPQLSKIESGKRLIHDVEQLRWIADRLDLPHDRLGLLPGPSADHEPAADLSASLGPVGDSQRTWYRVRRELNRQRHSLSRLAAELYPERTPAGNAAVLAPAEWLPAEPVELGSISLRWQQPAYPPKFRGSEAGARKIPIETVVPLVDEHTRYDRYSRAMRDLARPKLFDNRVCYRPVGIEFGENSGRLEFGYTSYFDALDVAEAIAHEFAAARIAQPDARLQLADLPLRAAIGDPFDPTARPMCMSINTLTLRQAEDGRVSFLLHKRSPAAVAAAGGVYHVIPCGVFQPSSVSPWDQANDFDLWRNVMREFSEELLGAQEHDGNSTEPIDYSATEPFCSLNQARSEGRIRPYCLGIVVEPLTLWVEVQTAVVIEAETFDDVFRGLVAHNDEGHLLAVGPGRLAEGIPFTRDSMERLAEVPLAPVAANLLHLAWKHRRALLG